MNCRQRVLAISLAATLILSPSLSWASGLLPDTMKSAATLAPADKTAIAKVIGDQLALLADDVKTDQQRAARDALVGETRLVTGAMGGAFFLDEYANQLSTAMTSAGGVIAKGSVRTRLNAAIVIARVAEVAPTWRLEPVIKSFVAANQPDAITMWGLRAAKPVILNGITIGQPGTLLQNKEIANAVKAHPSSMVADEAYEALTLPQETFKPEQLTKTVAALVETYKERGEIFKTGLPAEIGTDKRPLFYVTRATIWSTLQPAEQLSVMQSTYNILVGIRAQVANAKPEELVAIRNYIVEVIQTVSLSPVANGNAGFAAAAANAVALAPSPTVAAIQAALDPIPAAMKALPGMGGLTTAAAPTTKSSTGAGTVPTAPSVTTAEK